MKVLTEEFVKIRTMFLRIAAISNYPTITWNDFTEYCRGNKVVDKNCKLSDVDRMFIATNTNIDKIEDNPAKELCRYEFIEILLRIAIAKYKEGSAAESMKKLLTNIYSFTSTDNWQEFRVGKLWCIPVDNLYKANVDNLKVLFEKHTPKGKKALSMESVLHMVTDAQIDVVEKDVKVAYCFSKSSVVVEENEVSKQLIRKI